MSFHVLTVDQTAAVDTGSYLAHGVPADARGLLGAWTTKFGPLNQAIYLQEAENALDSDGPSLNGLALQSREKTFLRKVNPFAPRDGAKLYELRSYQLHTDQEETFLERMLGALPVRTRYTPNCGIWAALSGRSDRVFHLWGYSGVDERDSVRAKLDQDAAWQAYIPTILPLLQSMTSIILTPRPLKG